MHEITATEYVYIEGLEEVDFTIDMKVIYSPAFLGSAWEEPIPAEAEIIHAEIAHAEICGDRFEIAIDGSKEALSIFTDHIVEAKRKELMEVIHERIGSARF